ncbi:MAG TPA: MFS transporter [Pyrinomonadaceae bacterium]|jgi:MFS family permease|nr:MFS transporter [Pyrinomonadaceae bacterium]
MDSSPATPTQKVAVPRYSYYALSVLTLVNFLNYIDRQVLPAVAPSMRAELGLSQAEIGFMEDALLISFTVLALLFGRLGDRYSRTKLMAIAAAVWSIATGLTAITDHSPWLPHGIEFQIPILHLTVLLSGVALALCAVRALVGIGESSYSTITPTLIADYFPPDRRATALGTFQAAIPMGFALGYAIGGVLASYFGWRVAFMTVGLPGLITAVIVWLLKEPERGKTETAASVLELEANEPAIAGHNQSWLRTCWQIIRTRDWLLSTAGYTALTFVLGAFATWASSLLQEEKGMSELGANLVLGITTLAAGALGTFGGGWIADRIVAKKRNGYFLVCAVGSLLGIVPSILALVTHRPIYFITAIFLTVFFLFINNAPFHAILVSSVPPSIRASAMALNIVAIHLFGDVISRGGVGMLSDNLKLGKVGPLAGAAAIFRIDPIREHLTAALLLVPPALLISALFFYWGAKRHRR